MSTEPVLQYVDFLPLCIDIWDYFHKIDQSLQKVTVIFWKHGLSKSCLSILDFIDQPFFPQYSDIID
jgi:hypothetical protein